MLQRKANYTHVYKSLLKPAYNDGRGGQGSLGRRYTREQVLLLMIAASLRRRNVSLYLIRKLLPQIGRLISLTRPAAYLIITPKTAECRSLKTSAGAIRAFVKAHKGMILVSIAEHFQRLEQYSQSTEGEVGLSQLQSKTSGSVGPFGKKELVGLLGQKSKAAKAAG